MRSKKELTLLEIEGISVPCEIHREWRRSIRFSIGQKTVFLRIPSVLSKKQQQEQMRRLSQWVGHRFQKEPAIKKRFSPKTYFDGQQIQVGNSNFTLKISSEQRKNHLGKIKGDEIYLRLDKDDSQEHLSMAIPRILSRLISKQFYPEITHRVHTINRTYFKSHLGEIRMKYNKSNWGSCSSRGNINLSTRLLFAPKKVLDYVIIHELAHTKEKNHSSKFWAWVSGVMPDYKEQELWLKKNGHLCDF